MRTLLLGCTMAFALMIAMAPAQAATETLEVHFLPMQEAAELVRSQLSEQGRATTMPSRRLIVIQDDAKHIRQAKELLQRLDRPVAQYRLHLEMLEVARDQIRAVQVEQFQLPGGWMKIHLDDTRLHTSHRQVFDLRLSSGKPGHIEAGNIQPVQQTHQWLSNYGVVQQESVTLVPVTAGMHVRVQAADAQHATVRILPWIRRTVSASLQGRTEILIDLGTTDVPARPPPHQAPIRLNTTPSLNQHNVIDIAGAATEITVALGETVVLAAVESEAGHYGQALLSRHANPSARRLMIRLRLEQLR